MNSRTRMFELKRNMQLCEGGDKSCGKCAEHFGQLKGNGRLLMPEWVVNFQENRIEQAMFECKPGALELVEI